jgi:hypothetical protein
MKPAALIATVFLALVAGAHLVRVILQIEVTAAGVAIPMWPSVVACLFTGALATLLWRENRRR